MIKMPVESQEFEISPYKVHVNHLPILWENSQQISISKSEGQSSSINVCRVLESSMPRLCLANTICNFLPWYLLCVFDLQGMSSVKHRNKTTLPCWKKLQLWSLIKILRYTNHNALSLMLPRRQRERQPKNFQAGCKSRRLNWLACQVIEWHYQVKKLRQFWYWLVHYIEI